MSVDTATAQVGALGERLARTYPETYRDWSVRLEPLGENWRAGYRRGSLLLMAAAAVLLFVAATNVGGLLLARVIDRRRELAICAALGASPRWLAWQLVAETAVLVATGGLLGALAGEPLLRVFLAAAPVALPTYVNVAPTGAALALSAAALGLAGLVAGAAPLVYGRQVHPGEVLNQYHRGALGQALERGWGGWLVAGEVALTLVLLVAGSLLVRSHQQLAGLDPGYRRQGIARLAMTALRID